jgi:hypothetical protein
MGVVDSVFDLQLNLDRVGSPVTKCIALQSFHHHGQNFTRSLYSHFALSFDKNYFSTSQLVYYERLFRDLVSPYCHYLQFQLLHDVRVSWYE